MKIILALLITAFILIVPITAGARIFFDKQSGKLHFRLCIYEKIKLVSGYIVFEKNRAILHIGKKVKPLMYKSMFESKKKLDIFSGFDITELTALLEIGSAPNDVAALFVANAYNVVAGQTILALRNKHILFSSYNGVEIYGGEDVLRYNFNITILFNLLFLIIAIIKKILENIINGKRTKQNRKSHIKRDQELKRAG